MATPKLTHALPTLDPEIVARTTVHAVTHHLERLAMPLSPAYRVSARLTDPMHSALTTDIAQTVQQLTRYAQRGDLGDWADALDVRTAVQDVIAALYSAPVHCAQDGDGEDLDVDEIKLDTRSAIGVVLIATLTRLKIGVGEPVTARDLGALAGLSAVSVRALARAGELEIANAEIAADEARRWLSARGGAWRA